MLLPLRALNVIILSLQFNGRLLFVKLSVVQSFYRCQFCMSSSISRLYSAGNF